MLVDLHIHTTASDGLYSPEEVVQKAKSRHLPAISITDHDTVDGLCEAETACFQVGLVFVPGIELSCEWGASEVHILGYYIEPQDDMLNRRLERLRRERRQRAIRILEKLSTSGYPLSLEEVSRFVCGRVVGRPHIAQAMMEMGYVQSVAEAFESFLGPGGLAYVPRAKLAPAEAIEVIIGAGGVPVMAHPGVSHVDGLIPSLVSAGLKGIEVYYPDHTPGDIVRYFNLARTYGLVVTGGTDFHGTPHGPKECEIGDFGIPAPMFEELKAARPSGALPNNRHLTP